jgi:uncharacterized protein DUF1579
MASHDAPSARSHVAGPGGLDFWLGEWACSWEGGGGRNRITKELDDRVVVERFESLAPERWSGMSMSVYDEASGRWHQTWVDSVGNYWAFHEGREGDRLTFETDEQEEGREVRKRMVFSDVAHDSFAWRWERSSDRGATWEALWTIHYRRET